MRPLKIGLLTMSVGIAAGALGFFLGAGPCNATEAGITLLVLGFAAAPIGTVMAIIGLVKELAEKPPTAS